MEFINRTPRRINVVGKLIPGTLLNMAISKSWVNSNEYEDMCEIGFKKKIIEDTRPLYQSQGTLI